MSKENYYVDPVEFKESLRKYYESDNLTDDLAENIKKIAYGLSYNSSFINYTYKDDMIGDSLIKMYSALKGKKYKFSADCYKNSLYVAFISQFLIFSVRGYK